MTAMVRGQQSPSLADSEFWSKSKPSPRVLTNDPGVIVTIGPYVSTLNQYFTDPLKYRIDLGYICLSDQVNEEWDYR